MPRQDNNGTVAPSLTTLSQALAIIPARGGSKGIKRKNLKRVGGRELIARAVEACLGAELIGTVVVSTDDDEIAEVARLEGAHVIMRPAELASDVASSEAALLHVLDSLTGTYGALPDTTVFVQCTSPFIRSEDLDGAIVERRLQKADTVISVTETHRFLWTNGEGRELIGVNHGGGERERRQDIAVQYVETGAFYALDTAKFQQARERFMGRTIGYGVPEWTAVEIDTRFDLELARTIATSIPCEELDIDALVTDFDGVHTDDLMYLSDDGRETVRVSRSDGMGIGILRDSGMPILILSKEKNPVVRHRAEKLQVDVLHGVDHKLPRLLEWLGTKKLDPQRVAYVGNDVNDLECMRYVGWPIAVADAAKVVRESARVVLNARGGHGALREVADRVRLVDVNRNGQPAHSR